MHDTADHAALVGPLDASHIRWQLPFYPTPLLIVQPK
jgi:hypothetical protein